MTICEGTPSSICLKSCKNVPKNGTTLQVVISKARLIDSQYNCVFEQYVRFKAGLIDMIKFAGFVLSPVLVLLLLLVVVLICGTFH